jgi:hypothetical protein
LGTSPSSRRFKRDIQPIDRNSEAILALRPVAFHYTSDARNTPCFGLIAEEVAAVNSDLVVRDANGKPYAVRYDQVNAMLLNEFLQEHRKVEKLEVALQAVNARLTEYDSKIATLNERFKMTTGAFQTADNRPPVIYTDCISVADKNRRSKTWRPQ